MADDPYFNCGELVYIIPGIFGEDDKREFIVMSNSRGMFGGWQAWLVPSDNLCAEEERIPENILTRKNPFLPDHVDHRLTRTGRTLLIMRGGLHA